MQARIDQYKATMRSLVDYKDKKSNNHRKGLLSELIASQLTTKQKLDCIREVRSPESKVDLGQCLGITGGHAGLDIYLTFLTQSAKEPQMASEVFSLITRDDLPYRVGEALPPYIAGEALPLGQYIALYASESNNLSYLSLLNTLLDQGIPAQRLLAAETRFDTYYRFGAYLTYYQSATVVQAYINLLERMLKQDVTPKELFDFCTKVDLRTKVIGDNTQWSLLQRISNQQNTTTNKAFNLFLAKLLYAITKTEALRDEQYPQFAFLKEAMLDYIRTLPENERMQACINGMGTCNHLGRLIWQPRLGKASFLIPESRRMPRPGSGVLGQLGKDLKVLEAKQARVTERLLEELRQAHADAATSSADSIRIKAIAFFDKLQRKELSTANLLTILFENKDGQNFGMHLAQFDDQGNTCQEYLSLLSRRLDEGSAKRIYELLIQKNSNESTLGHILVSRVNPEMQGDKIAEQYIDLLIKLRPHILLEDFYKLLKMSSKIGTVANHLAAHARPAVTKYLTILSDLLKANLAPQDLYDLLAMENVNKHIFGYLIAKNLPDCTSRYLTLLSDLLTASQPVSAGSIYRLLGVVDRTEKNYLVSA